MKIRQVFADPTQLAFNCPGCGHTHNVNVGTGPGPRWSFNGDYESPTFEPSIFVKTVKIGEHNREAYDLLGREEIHDTIEDPRFRWWCHSFVRDGSIQFLSDSSHHLAGQTVPLPEIVGGWPQRSTQ